MTPVTPIQADSATTRSAARQQQLVEEAVIREAPALLAYLTRRVSDPADAADLLGDVLVVVWRRIDSMPFEPEQARMWMFGIARKTLAGGHRAARRHQALTDRLRHEITTTNSAADLTGGTARDLVDPRAERLTQALSQLSHADQEILSLVHWDFFTLTEAGQHLRLRPSTTRSRYHRARIRLTQVLDSDRTGQETPPAHRCR